eukprot:scaffold228374_cov18-Tisochrysis_lutea.AAC.1
MNTSCHWYLFSRCETTRSPAALYISCSALMAGSAPGAPPRDLYTACTTSRMAARSMGALCRGAPASGPKGYAT